MNDNLKEFLLISIYLVLFIFGAIIILILVDNNALTFPIPTANNICQDKGYDGGEYTKGRLLCFKLEEGSEVKLFYVNRFEKIINEGGNN